MQLRYDDDFVEGAVFLCARGPRPPTAPAPALQIARFHREREKLYWILDPDDRNAAFFRLHLEWFREWGLEQQLIGCLDEFPRLRTALQTLVFRQARVGSDEGAELYVSAENGWSAVVAMRVERFDHPDQLARFLRRELAHVDDMVNPAFGYSPQLRLPVLNAAQQRLTRERYRLLWNITIDGRLSAAAGVRQGPCSSTWVPCPPVPVGDCSREHHRAAFDRVFGFWPERKRDDVFESLWTNGHPRHEALLALAADPRDLHSTCRPVPGAPCPLCGFATFDWAGTSGFDGQITAAIQREFPHWTTDQGACGRCVAVYRVLGVQLAAAL